MSDLNHQPTPDILDQATEALRDAPVPAGPPADLTAATLAAVHNRLAGAVPVELARHQRRRRIMRYVGFGTATVATVAAVAIATVAALVWSGGSAAAHVQKALDNAERAKSVKVIVTTPNAEAPGKMTHAATIFREGGRVRSETVWMPPDVPVKPVTLADLKTRKMLTLTPETKTAQRGTLGAQESQALIAMMGNFAQMKAGLTGGDNKSVKAVGEEEIDGRKTKVYEITAAAPLPGVWKVWVDPTTDLPVRLADGRPGGGIVLNFEDWNKEFDAKLFSLDVPEGYKVTEPPKAPSAPDAPQGFAILLGPMLVKVKQAESVTFVMKERLGTQGELVLHCSIKGPRMRIEFANGTALVMDTKQRIGVMLFPQQKGFLRLDKEKLHSPAAGSPIADLLALRDRKPESAVEDKLDGKAVQKITVKGDPKADPPGDWVIWVDPKTELPVKMAYEGKILAGGKEVTDRKVYEQFVWNAKLDDKLFKLDVPEGYTEGFPGQKKGPAPNKK
jgi:outer membrane lipoprotein-sorting protein